MSARPSTGRWSPTCIESLIARGLAKREWRQRRPRRLTRRASSAGRVQIRRAGMRSSDISWTRHWRESVRRSWNPVVATVSETDRRTWAEAYWRWRSTRTTWTIRCECATLGREVRDRTADPADWCRRRRPRARGIAKWRISSPRVRHRPLRVHRKPRSTIEHGTRTGHGLSDIASELRFINITMDCLPDCCYY